jgi:hypothetical protein
MGVSRLSKAPRGFIVGRLLDRLDKEIAHSVLFLSPVLATRQSSADDSDTFGISWPGPTLPASTCPALTGGFFHDSYDVVHNHRDAARTSAQRTWPVQVRLDAKGLTALARRPISRPTPLLFLL